MSAPAIPVSPAHIPQWFLGEEEETFDPVPLSFQAKPGDSPINESFKEIVRRFPIDMAKIKAGLPEVDEALITEVYLEFVSGKNFCSEQEKASVIEVLLGTGKISTENVKLLFLSSVLSWMNDDLITNMFTSLNPPIEAPLIAACLKRSNNVEKIFNFCWKHSLLKTLRSLAPLSVKRFSPFLREEIKKAINPEIAKKIFVLVHYFTDDLQRAVFSFLATLDESVALDPAVLSLRKEFFLNENVYKNLISGEAPLDHLKIFFKVNWSLRSTLGAHQIDKLIQIAQRIYPLDQEFVDQIVQEAFKSGIPPSINLFSCLSQTTLDQLDENLTVNLANWLTADSPVKAQAESFLNACEQQSLLVRRYRYPAGERGFSWVCPGNQFGKDGEFDEDKTRAIVEALNKSAPSSVAFDMHKIPSSLDGGTCSAMTLRALKLYRLEKSNPENGIRLKALKKVGPAILTSNEEYRAIQAAYNTIHRAGVSADFKRDKMSALLKVENPDLEILDCSAELDLNVPSDREKLTQQFTDAPDGLYLVRALNPVAQNDLSDGSAEAIKEENYGHTTLFIKEEGEHFYFDPTVGILKLEMAQHLQIVLEWQNLRSKIPLTRFYRLG